MVRPCSSQGSLPLFSDVSDGWTERGHCAWVEGGGSERTPHISYHPFGVSSVCLAPSMILGQPQIRTTYLNPASSITDSVTSGKGLRHAESLLCPSGMLKISIQRRVCHKVLYCASFPSPAPGAQKGPAHFRFSLFTTNTCFIF